MTAESEAADRAADPLFHIAPVVAELDDLGVTIDLDDAGRVIVGGNVGAIDWVLRVKMWVLADLIRWTVIGRRSGHVWAPCDRCGMSTQVPVRRQTPSGKWVAYRPHLCVMTPRCHGDGTDGLPVKGRHRIPPNRLVAQAVAYLPRPPRKPRRRRRL